MTFRPAKTKGDSIMGLTHVAVRLRDFGSDEFYTANFLVDTGAMDAFAPASELRRVGIRPVGKKVYELANGELVAYEYGLAEISFLGELTAGEIVFGPEGTEPILGVIALEHAGLLVDAKNGTLIKLAARPLKTRRIKLVA
jgi:clan AA aspartic protease